MLSEEFTDEEIINFIITFHDDFVGGYLDWDLDQEEGAREFVYKGFAEKSKDDPDFYKLSKTGDEYLHSCIAKITEEFTEFVGPHKVNIDDANKWFVKQYKLSDLETGEEICKYIVDNSTNYTTVLCRGYSNRWGNYIAANNK